MRVALRTARVAEAPSRTNRPLEAGSLCGTDVYDGSGAFGINEHSTIVGWTDTDVTCPNEPALDLSLAFRMQPAGAMTVLDPDGGYGGSDNYNAAAFAGNTPSPPPAMGFFPVVAGVGNPCSGSFTFCGEQSSDAQAWTSDDPQYGRHDLTEPPGFGDGRGEARDVNDADQLAGWGTKQGSPCVERALFWQSATSTPDNLHEIARFPDDSQIPATDDTRAEAMNEVGQVVRRNLSTNHAYLWSADAGQWTVVDLNDEINSSCMQDNGDLKWELNQGRDINESGVIVGSGVHGNNVRAFLLMPIATCLWDIAGPQQSPPDGNVDVVDFLALLAAFGPCDPPKGLCMADFDCDLTVGVTDNLELLAHFGACSVVCAGGSAANGIGAGPSVGEIEAAVVSCGFLDMEAFFEWMNTASDREAAAMIDVLAALLLE